LVDFGGVRKEYEGQSSTAKKKMTQEERLSRKSEVIPE
jgi:hypothetical protein